MSGCGTYHSLCCSALFRCYIEAFDGTILEAYKDF